MSESDNDTADTSGDGNVYETDRALREYLLFHYGEPDDILPWPLDPGEGALEYPVRIARLALAACARPPVRALDLGCAVGRTSFELARGATEVVGVDLSRSFVDAAQRLAREGEILFEHRVRGSLSARVTARPPAGVDRNRVSFRVGDATTLPNDLGAFDLAVLANLIDRLPDPSRCLERLSRRIRPGGTLLVSSPYTWLEEFTPRERWLGGTETDPDPRRAIGGALGDEWELISAEGLPFLLREHERKYQWSWAEATIWRRADGSPAVR